MGCSNSSQLKKLPNKMPAASRSSGAPLTPQEILSRIDAIKQSTVITIANYQMNYAYVSQRGYYPDSPLKANQDQYTCLPQLGDLENTAFFAVYDGHGKDGDGVSGYCRDNLHHNLYAAIKENPNIAGRDMIELISKVHVDTNNNLHTDSKVNDSLSGTTAISILFRGKTMFISNVGDSRAIVVSDEDGKFVAKALSNDQTPYRKDERERCKLYGARILTMDQLEGIEPIHENWGDLTLGEQIDEGGDPPRIWAPTGSYPGTAFTRSIGDRVAEEFGVVAEPEIIERDIRGNDKYLVIASDGVWEFITNQMVADILTTHEDPLQACRAIVALAYELWLQYEIRTDDITIIAFYLQGNEDLPSLLDGTRSPVTRIAAVPRPVRRAISRAQRQQMITETEALMAADKHIDFITPIEKLMASKYVPKTEAEKQSILKTINHNFLFVQMDDSSKDALTRVMCKKTVNAGDVIISQGDVAKNFYVVESGRYEVRVKPQNATSDADGLGNLIQVYEPSDGYHPSFGELSVMYGKPRAASVIAATEGSLWTLDIHLFARLVLKANVHQEILLKTLKGIHILKCLNLVQLQKLVNIMEEEHLIAGDYMVSQGDDGDRLFIIQSGRCKCTVNMVHDDGRKFQTPIATLLDGDYFGERTLLALEPRASNVVAETDVICYSVTKNAFESALGPLSKLIDEDLHRRSIAAEKRKSAPEIFEDINMKGIVLSDQYGSLTVGSFRSENLNVTVRSYVLSEVEARWLSRGISNTLEATKIISQSAAASKFIPEMMNSYRVPNAFHLVYSSVIVADLVTLMRTCGAMAAEPSGFIAACVVAAIEALHSIGIIYRAVQPECLYLDSDGRVVLLDYEVCKLGGVGGKSYTICGASDYLSPEQISQEGHSSEVDLWQLGVLLFEVSSGQHIFTCATDEETYTKITSFANSARATISYPESVPVSIRSLISKLIVGNPSKRLGGGKEGIEALKKHQAFSKVTWNEKYFVQNSPLRSFTQYEQNEVLERKLSPEFLDSWNTAKMDDYSWVDNMLDLCGVEPHQPNMYDIVATRKPSEGKLKGIKKSSSPHGSSSNMLNVV